MSDIKLNIKAIEKANNNIVDFLNNPFIKYGFLIFVVLRIIFISDMDDYYLNLFNYPIVKILYALVIAYSACFDPVYAVALTTLIIITLQELYQRNAKKKISQTVVSENNKPFLPSQLESTRTLSSTLLDSSVGKSLQLPTDAKVISNQSVSIDKMPEQGILINDSMVYNEINKHALQRTPDPKDTMIAEFDFYEDPAYRTITANLTEKNYLGHNKFFVTENNLNQIQNNLEPNVNQNISVQAFPKVLNIQGLPNGFDKGLGGSNPQLAAVDSP